MPNIFIGSLKTAKADAGSEKTLTSPHIAGNHLQFSDP